MLQIIGMTPYGLKRPKSMMESPDCADIAKTAQKSSVGNSRGKGGSIRSNFKKPSAKARIRRNYKRKARQAGKEQVREGSGSES